MEEVSPERPPTPATPDVFGTREKKKKNREGEIESSESDADQVEAEAKENDRESSGSSPGSFVYQDHSYSLPPQEEPLLEDRDDDEAPPTPPGLVVLDHDHGYTKAQQPPVPEKTVKPRLKATVEIKNVCTQPKVFIDEIVNIQ